MLFKQLAHYFDVLEKEPSRLAMMRTCAAMLKEASPHEARRAAYFVLGQLRPSYEGPTLFQIAERSAIHVVAAVLGSDEHEIRQSFAITGDLGSVLHGGSWDQSRYAHEYTVEQMFDALQAVEVITGVGSQEGRQDALVTLLRQATSVEACWIMRIVLGKLRLGLSDMTIIDALAYMLTGDKSLKKEIEHAYNVSADIGLVAATARELGIEGIRAMKPNVGIPVRPAAAERLPTAEAIFAKIGPCIAEPKVDGFRIQFHLMRHNSVRTIMAFSRNLLPMHGMFPDLEEALKNLPVDNAIVEGEAIAYSEETQRFLPFQETVKRRRKHGIDVMTSTHPLRIVLFDMLMCDGEVMLDKPHDARYQRLAQAVRGVNDAAVAAVSLVKIASAAELQDYFLANVGEGYEGIMTKRPDAPYQAGVRNFNWIKLKRHTIGQLEDTIDAVVLGYYHGKGKRADFGIGAALLGVYDADKDEIVTIAKIGTGFSDEGWRELKKLCDEHAMDRKPPTVRCSDALAPDVWVEAKIIIEVAADEITQSPIHTAGRSAQHHYGFALRFPRAMGIRIDKSLGDATTVAEVRRLYEDQRALTEHVS